jgi:hypothetical protein
MDGNEFAFEFELKTGLFIEVLTVDVVNWGVDIGIDHSKSFTTPFGPGATFPVMELRFPLKSFDFALLEGSVGFVLTPRLGSDKFTADWTAMGDASGSGTMLFTDPAVSVPIGPVKAIDGPGIAEIRMDAFRYYFTQFILDAGLYFYINAFDIWSDTWDAYLVQFDLSSIMGHLWIGPHSGTPSMMTAGFDIENVAPTAVLDRTGTVDINGIPTFMASAGDVLTFTGEADDPGYDDLTLTWDYDDGDPSPDVSTLYPVPYHVSETQTYAFDDACVYWVTFEAVDDDGAVGMDQVPVLVTGDPEEGHRPRSEGYWQHQVSRRGHMDYDMTEIECALGIVCHISTVFSEARDACDVEAAHDVMHLKQNHGSRLEQLDRELLAVWLNFAVGACAYQGMVDIDGDGIGDATFEDVLSTAEAVRLDPGSTDKELKEQTDILHQINNGGMIRFAGGPPR